MKIYLIGLLGIMLLFCLKSIAQTKTVGNGATVPVISFPGGGCIYNWVNNHPEIGLAASGTGNIASFTAVNNGSTPITATITATPVPVQQAYIAGGNPGTVTVVNTQTNAVSAVISVGDNPESVWVNPNGLSVYVLNSMSNNVSVISTASNTVTAVIPVGNSPQQGCISSDGKLLYVGNFNDNSVSVISTASNTVTAIIKGISQPTALAINPSGTLLYASSQNGTISVISTAMNTVLTTFNVSNIPWQLTVSPDGSKLYMTTESGNSVLVVNTANKTVTATIPVALTPEALVLSPDGSLLYVGCFTDGEVDVINTTTNAVVKKIYTGSPLGLSLTADGKLLYVVNNFQSTVSVYNAITGSSVTSVPVSSNPNSFGSFVGGGEGCQTETFSIIVNPAPAAPTITPGPVTGTISACEGTASASPNVQQFTVSGNNLTNAITATSQTGFEISLSPTSGYTGNLTIPQTGGAVANIIVYVRSSASAPVGNIPGNITLTSTGAANQTVPVSAIVNALPQVDPVGSPAFTNTVPSTPINFTGTGTSYTWTNSNPAIGLPASGTGNIASFTPVNHGTTPVTAQVVVIAQGNTSCPGNPLNFTITVNPITISTTGMLSPLNTIYGTPSSPESFSVSGTVLTGGILVTPPPGFELSTDNINFSPTVTVGSSGTIPATPVYIRLAAASPVNGYSGDITLTNAGAATVNVAMPLSTVTPAPLTITADNQTKIFDTPNPFLTASYSGFVNNESPSFLTSQPVLSTTALLASLPGEYPITITGAKSPNYTITTFAGVLTILPNQIVIPNTFTPNGDGVNDNWNIGLLNTYTNCTVNIFTRWGQKVYTSIGYGTPWDGTCKGVGLPIGTYYYIIDLKNDTKLLYGFVALIR